MIFLQHIATNKTLHGGFSRLLPYSPLVLKLSIVISIPVHVRMHVIQKIDQVGLVLWGKDICCHLR